METLNPEKSVKVMDFDPSTSSNCIAINFISLFWCVSWETK